MLWEEIVADVTNVTPKIKPCNENEALQRAQRKYYEENKEEKLNIQDNILTIGNHLMILKRWHQNREDGVGDIIVELESLKTIFATATRWSERWW